MMYTDEKVYQIIISLFKEWGLKHCVLSAGSRNVPFVHSVEEDSFFKCYSVVDERNAAYFAMGMAQEIRQPVVISCTSSTATCNYWPAVAEAFYQNIPLVVLTSDRDPAMLHQWEDQMIDQVGMYDRHVKKSVNLPIIQSEEDVYYAQRLINEALIVVFKKKSGPVQINVPTRGYNFNFNTKNLLQTKKIDYVTVEDTTMWERKKIELMNAKKVMIISGQNSFVSDNLAASIHEFEKKSNSCIVEEYMGNIPGENVLNISVCFDVRYMNRKEFEKYLPDIVISFGGNIMAGVKEFLRMYSGRVSHWCINPEGEVVDTFKNISTVFHCSPEYFFGYYSKKLAGNNDRVYYNLVKQCIDRIQYPEFDYSNIYAIKNVVENIPEGSLLHLSINNSIRITNFFKLKKDVKVYANIGTHGIDGVLPSFLGQARCNSSRICFLIIGDLSFFYGMNALAIKNINNNVHILLLNNHGGEEFYYNGVWQNKNSDKHTTARHNLVAKNWVESNGFMYLSAHNKEDFDNQIQAFLGVNDKPVLFEVFSEMSSDAKKIYDFYDLSRPREIKNELLSKGKQGIKSIIGKDAYDKLKKIMK